MGVTTNIAWCDVTWNIARGCTKKNEDCLYCFMMRDGDKFGYNGNEVQKTKSVFKLPYKIEPNKKVFVSSLTDIFHEQIDSFREEAYQIMRENDKLIYQWLTKRWERMEECLPHDWNNGWDNIWLGCSAGSQKRLDELTPYLEKVKAKIKWLSIEPMHQPIIDIPDFINWVVLGGESGNDLGKWRYRPIEVPQLLRVAEICAQKRIPLFVKQFGTYLSKKLKMSDRHGSNINEFPEELKIREFPMETKINRGKNVK